MSDLSLALQPEIVTHVALLALLAMIAESLLPWPEKWHPITLIQLLARQMGRKVRPALSAAKQQQWISGSLAFLVLFGPILIVIGLLLELAAYRAFFECILLTISLSYSAQRQRCKQIAQALAKDKKSLAKEWLATVVCRDTNSLSPIGIGKATVETLLIRLAYQYVTVLAIFVLGGAVFALAYRMALECRWQWQRPNADQDHFVTPITLFCRPLQWLGVVIVNFILFIAVWPRNNRLQGREAVKVVSPTFRIVQPAPQLLHLMGKKLGAALSGPAFYATKKRSRPRFGAPLQLRLSDVLMACSIVDLIRLLIAVSLVAYLVAISLSI